METKEPIYINGEPVYDVDSYTQGKKPKKITNTPKQKLTNEIEFDYQDETNTIESDQEYEYDQTTQTPNYGKTSMILGILSIVFANSVIIPIVLGIIAINMANKSTNPSEENPKKIGKITGIIGIGLAILTIITGIANVIGTDFIQELINNY